MEALSSFIITSVWSYNQNSDGRQTFKPRNAHSWAALVPPYDHHRSSAFLHAKSKMSKKDHPKWWHPVWKTQRYLKDSWEWWLLGVNVHGPLVCVYYSPHTIAAFYRQKWSDCHKLWGGSSLMCRSRRGEGDRQISVTVCLPATSWALSTPRLRWSTDIKE